MRDGVTAVGYEAEALPPQARQQRNITKGAKSSAIESANVPNLMYLFMVCKYSRLGIVIGLSILRTCISMYIVMEYIRFSDKNTRLKPECSAHTPGLEAGRGGLPPQTIKSANILNLMYIFIVCNKWGQFSIPSTCRLSREGNT